jgi:hypothetical protein
MPELQMGFFGGDPDNFTYPRYALDCSFFRVYDESGKPLQTKYFYKFNPQGAKEGEAVFVVGNPGRTERLSTQSQLDFFREVSYPANLSFLRNRANALKKFNEEAKSDSILNLIFSLENSHKAVTGMLKGLQDDHIYARKMAFEKAFKSKIASLPQGAEGMSVWNEIASCRQEIKKVFADYFVLQPRDISAKSMVFARLMAEYVATASDSAKQHSIKKQLIAFTSNPTTLEKELLKNLWLDLMLIPNSKENLVSILGTSDVDLAINKLYQTPYFTQKDYVNSLLKMDVNALKISDDVLLKLGKQLYERFLFAKTTFDSLVKKETILNAKLAQLFFAVYGKAIPPDATFSLRIADGVVKGYDYNGTTAPYKTTFYGLYDRYYSFDTKFPFSLPKRWTKPSVDFLKSPYNFVSTNDIIGGNSGSAIINQHKEAVGLIFDGNIESLPGRFIYTDEANRTVSVHTGGILAALNYIYKANRLRDELLGK